MKILFAIKALDNIKGGAERVFADTTRGLAEKGYAINVLTFDHPDGKSFYPLDYAIRQNNLGIGDSKKSATLWETLKRIYHLRQYVVREKPDLVVAFMHSMFIPMSIALLFTGIPVIASEHIVPDHYKNRRFEYVMLGICGLFCKRITVISRRIRKTYPAFLRRRMSIVPNAVKTPKKFAKPEGFKTKRNVVLSVGRFAPQKDQQTLIVAFAQIADKFPDWDLRIIGDGPLRKELETLVRQLDMESRIFLPGTTSQIDKEYERVQLFVIPSLYESFGLATAEAMSFGLPAIGFRGCPGTNELIQHKKNGLLADDDNRVAALKDCMSTLMKSEKLRVQYGECARSAVERYYPEKIVTIWERLIQETIGR